jgi:Ser-tRNA(Ala) deacylase AlaX
MSKITFVWPTPSKNSKVMLGGTFTNWRLTDMSLNSTLCTSEFELPPGIHQYKFAILTPPHEIQWFVDPDKPQCKDIMGNINNWIRVMPSSFSPPSPIEVQPKPTIPKERNTQQEAPIQNEKTQLDYWNDTYLFTTTAKVVGIMDIPEKSEKAVILSNTIFYPQGGGQPSDMGTIESTTTQDISFKVTSLKSEKGIVYHYGKFLNGEFGIGDIVRLVIDQVTRMTHARLHSAGHLLDVAVHNLGLSWVPGKGYHFPAGPYVEYSGELSNDKKNTTQEQIQNQIEGLLSARNNVKAEILEYDKIAAACGSVPNYLPPGLPARVVTVAGNIGCPCGGTHVKDIADIGPFKITKITTKKSVIRVSYKLA